LVSLYASSNYFFNYTSS